jgi:uncharacterized protein (TIGR03382 family)
VLEAATMKVHRPVRLAAAFALLLSVAVAQAQGTFQNLGFESARIVPAPGYPASQYLFADAFPGWTGYAGDVQQVLTLYNNLYMDTAGLSIIDAAFVNRSGLPGGLIQGNYTAVLMSGIAQLGQPSDTTIVQTGLVPVGTESLRFNANLAGTRPSDTFGVALGGQTLSFVPVASGVNYTTYAADIHVWAGQTAELAFTAFAQRPHSSDTYLYLDSIQFSTQPAPEPGVVSLLALGALLLGWRVWRRR